MYLWQLVNSDSLVIQKIKDLIESLADEMFPEIVAHRRYLHMHPELSFQEIKTSAYIKQYLHELDLEVRGGVGGHGIVAVLKGTNPEAATVALRADMDALPIQEDNEVEYRSRVDGVMHACGHDVHSSSLLGSAMILSKLSTSFEGTVKFLFQPAEEKLPGGASLMIEEGALEDPVPVSIFAQHVHPPLEVGKVGVKSGMYMASADELYLTVKGKGGHAALPHETIDPIVISSNIVIAMQQLISRSSNPTIPTVLTFGKIHSEGGATNVIPEVVHLQGTFRTMDEVWRMNAHEKMQQIAQNVAAAHGGSVNFRIEKGYPHLHNDEELTTRFRAYAKEYVGDNNLVELPVRMTAEDFSYYSQRMNACFYRIGTGNLAKGITSPVHTSSFDIDEDALRLGSGLMAFVALRELAYHTGSI